MHLKVKELFNRDLQEQDAFVKFTYLDINIFT